MAGEHYLEFRNFTTGARLGITTGATGSGASARNGFRRLTVHKVVNAPGSIYFDLEARHPLLPFADKTLVLDWRRDTARGIDWYTEHVGIIRNQDYASQHGDRTVHVYATGLMSLLDFYHVLWPQGVTNRTVFTGAKAETIMKTLVDRNAVIATATVAAGRDRQAPDYGITDQADAAGGTTIDWVAGRTHTLLEELQAIALVGGGDFDLIATSATVREFRFYAGQRGTDKSATITFAENLSNMDNVVFKQPHDGERTAVVVGGQGEGTDREFVVRTGANYSATNDIEWFLDAADIARGATAALNARGDSRLDEVKTRNEFSFAAIQTEGTAYKRDYEVGDLVSAIRPDGVKVTQQVYAVTLDWPHDGKETIAVEVRTK